jgi:multiple sugar transport system ATP-binding protein
LLGDSVLLGVTVGNDLVNMKVGPDGGRAIGSEVAIRLNPAKLHVFHRDTGLRLARERHSGVPRPGSSHVSV